MPVRVYLVNQEQALIVKAVRGKFIQAYTEAEKQGSDKAWGDKFLDCLDENDGLVARFIASQIAGYEVVSS